MTPADVLRYRYGPSPWTSSTTSAPNKIGSRRSSPRSTKRRGRRSRGRKVVRYPTSSSISPNRRRGWGPRRGPAAEPGRVGVGEIPAKRPTLHPKAGWVPGRGLPGGPSSESRGPMGGSWGTWIGADPKSRELWGDTALKGDAGDDSASRSLGPRPRHHRATRRRLPGHGPAPPRCLARSRHPAVCLRSRRREVRRGLLRSACTGRLDVAIRRSRRNVLDSWPGRRVLPRRCPSAATRGFHLGRRRPDRPDGAQAAAQLRDVTGELSWRSRMPHRNSHRRQPAPGPGRGSFPGWRTSTTPSRCRRVRRGTAPRWRRPPTRPSNPADRSRRGTNRAPPKCTPPPGPLDLGGLRPTRPSGRRPVRLAGRTPPRSDRAGQWCGWLSPGSR